MKKSTLRFVKKNLLVLTLLLSIMPLARALSPTAWIDGNLIYVCYLPYSLALAALLLFGSTAALPLYLALFISFQSAGSSLPLSLGLTCSLLTPLLGCAWLARRWLGRRWRHHTGMRAAGTRLLLLTVAAPLLTRLALTLWGERYPLPDSAIGYVSSHLDLYSLLNLEILMVSALIFTPLFSFPLRMLLNASCARRLSASLVAPQRGRLALWLALLLVLLLPFCLGAQRFALSSYLVPLVFILFACGVLLLAPQPLAFLWAICCYILMYCNLQVLSANSLDSFAFLTTTFIAFTISLHAISAAWRKSQWLQQAFYRLSLTDPLVQRPNLRALVQRLQTQPHGTLCYLYLHNLSFLGRHYGMQMHTHCKRQVTDVLQAQLRHGEQVYQIAGDGLLLLLDDGEIAARLRTLRDRLSLYPLRWRQNAIDIDYAFAAGAFNGKRDDLWYVASQLSYLAEMAISRGGIILLDKDCETISERVCAEVMMLQKVRKAIARREIELFAQPIVSDRRQHRYYEVLSRLRDGESRITPDKFIPLVLACHLSAAFDLLVIEKTVQFIQQRCQNGNPPPCLAINLFAATLTEPGMAATIIALFSRHQVPHDTIIFEVTEEQPLFTTPVTMQTIGALRQAGFRIAIDDFGSGFANYHCIKQLDIDIIKIDGLFIKNIDTDTLDRLIVKSICDIAHEKKLSVVAEYVETHSQQRRLMALGVDYLQGYLLGRPAPLEAIP